MTNSVMARTETKAAEAAAGTVTEHTKKVIANGGTGTADVETSLNAESKEGKVSDSENTQQENSMEETPVTESPVRVKVSETAKSSTGTWHVNPAEDVEPRRIIIRKILQLLDGCKPKAFAGQPKKLLVLAKRLEVALYKASPTRDEYMDTGTLRGRVVNLVKQSNAAQGKSGKSATTQDTATLQKAAQVDKQRAEILKQRQQRLLLLRHASQCSVPETEKCTITPHCGAMKKLWSHISKCKNQQCSVSHCVSSRFVLSHYHRCTLKKCPVCSPVRLISHNKRNRSPEFEMVSNQTKRHKPTHINGPKSVPTMKASSASYSNTSLVRRAKSLSNGDRINPRLARSCISGTGPSLPLSMTKPDLESHLQSLKVERLRSCVTQLLRRLMESKHNKGVFNDPVDPVALNLPDYEKIVKHPMDLGTIRQKLEDGKYSSLESFESDVKLTFNNAIKFNPPEHAVHQMAVLLSKSYDADVPKILAKVNKETKRRNDKCQLCFQKSCEVCPLCDRGCIAFEPRVIYCSGPCASRIGRNSTFWTGPGCTYNWCTDCYEKSRDGLLTAGTLRYKKSDMEKKRNNELFAEPWVSCDCCEKWVHQVCALFNTRKNSPNSTSSYTCPDCLFRHAKDAPAAQIEGDTKAESSKQSDAITKVQVNPSSSPVPVKRQNGRGSLKNGITLPADKHVPGAVDLEQTKIGVFLENWVRDRYSKAREKLGKENKLSGGIRGDLGPDPSKMFVRVLSNHDEECKVKPFVKRAIPSYPDSFGFRSRCLFLFQELDGVEVLIYAMFVQEYGSDCPEPNKRKLYIAYLDSVHYFRPRKLRTLVYHELLLAYLEYSRRSGFASAYIWACPPPNKRDDYILHCHPEEQRVPSADRLRKWYHDMIYRGCEDGIIISSCSLFEEHFESTSRPAKPKKSTSRKTKKEKVTKKGRKKGQRKPIQVKDDDKDDALKLLDSLPSIDTATATADASIKPTDDEVKENGESKSLFAPAGNGLSGCDDKNLSENVKWRKEQKLATNAKMPYFEGDYWPQEAEELGKEQESKRKKELDKRRTGRSARKRNRDDADGDKKDEEAVPMLSPEVAKRMLLGRLSEQLEAMKDDFIVVKLAHECARCGKYLLRGRWECRHPDCTPSKTDPGYSRACNFALCNTCYILENARPVEQQHGGGCIAKGAAGKAKVEKDERFKESGGDQKEVAIKVEEKQKEEKTSGDVSEKSKVVADKEVVKSEPTKTVDAADAKIKEGGKDKPSETVVAKEGEPAAKRGKGEDGKEVVKTEASVKKEDVKKNPKSSKSKSKGNATKYKPVPNTMLVDKIKQWNEEIPTCTRIVATPTADHTLHYVDENLPIKTPRHDRQFKNHLVETRHAFLSLCTGNKYQFDQLRRAKHSTMMVLYHLHNPDAPAHLYTCNECSSDILAGKRFHCDLCAGGDFDLCQTCVRRVHHVHRLDPYVVSAGVNTSHPDAKRIQQRVTEMRRARKHSLHLFLQALVHASACFDVECDRAPCKKMKDLLKHRLNCQVRVRGGCEVCRRVLCLVQMHARSCQLANCRVPHCDDLKAHLAQQLQLSKQKQEAANRSTGRSRGRGRPNKAKVTAAQGVKATVVAGSGGTRLKIRGSTLAKPPRSGRARKKRDES